MSERKNKKPKDNPIGPLHPVVKPTFESQLKGDFRVFMTLIWKELNLPKPTNMQLLFGDILQKSTARKLCMLGYRGFAKTYISVTFLLWLLYKNPSLKEAIWGSNQEAAGDSTQMMLRLIKDVPWLQHLAPTGDMDQSVLSFDVQGRGRFRGSSVTAMGITGGVTGTRADILLMDDPETSSNGDTLKKRTQIDRAMNEATFVLTDGGRIIVLGTVHFDDSVYTRLLQQGYKVYLFPMAVPGVETQKLCWDYYPDPIKRLIEQLENGKPGSATGKPLDRFSESEIELKKGTGLLAFERQCLVNPFRTTLSQKPLDMKRIIIFPADQEKLPIRFFHGQQDEYIDEEAMSFSSASITDKLYRPYKIDETLKAYDYKLMFVDPAGTGGDEVAIVVVFAANGYAVLMHCEGLVGGATTENLQHILEVGKRFKVNELCVEDNLNFFAQLLRAEYHKMYGRFGRQGGLIPITTHHATINKEKRIAATLDPVVNGGRLVIHPTALYTDFESANSHASEARMAYRLTYQISYFSESGSKLDKDDRIDALASALEKLKGWLSDHPEVAADDYESWLIDRVFKNDEKQFESQRGVVYQNSSPEGLSVRGTFLR